MDSLLSTTLAAAEAAAAVHLQYFGRLGVEGAQEKAHSDFVSQVDLEAQEAAIQVIARNHPHPLVLAEEEGGSFLAPIEPGSWPEGAEHLWIVDPLDGTTNYLHRHPQFAASVGVWSRSHESVASSKSISRIVMEAGAVVAPRTGERWWARRGRGAFKNGRRIRVSATRSLRAALIGTGFPFKEPALVPRYLEEFGRVLPASGGIRRGGSAAMDLCYLAEGILDAFWEEDYLSPWDVAAGLVILSEAGGVATRLDGSAVDLAPGSILGANSPHLLEALAALVKGR